MLVEEKALSKRMGVNLKGWRHNGRFIGYKLFYKVSERTIVYDEEALTVWIREQDGKHIHSEQNDLDKLISKWQANQKVNRTS